MWILLWLGLVLLIAAFWLAPEYAERRVYPHVLVEADTLSEVADVGDEVVFRCRMTNPSRLPCPRVVLSMQLPEELAAALGSEERNVRVETYLLPRQTADIRITVYAVRRGVARWNQAELQFTDMFGLRKSDRTVYTQAQVIVRPSRRVSDGASPLMNELIGELRTQRFYQEDPSLFTGVRPYSRGDSMRAVSWFATARTGELMVKQFGYTTESRVLLLLSGQMHEAFWKIPQRDVIDELCEQAMQLTDRMIGERTSVGLLTNLTDGLGGDRYLSPEPGLVQRERIANRLGSLSLHPALSLADLLRSAARIIRPGETLVLLTAFQDEEAEKALAELKRMHPSVYAYPNAHREEVARTR
ncbi:DUF58 domain-containing protein [Gorillibacterium sp. CAU 1737]|uniref:DUF58 domain-containing protein n=1 Tax=Gorillibacterium sp. CAU 1737 TaxID=3140362 RepID=UPI0032606C9D